MTKDNGSKNPPTGDESILLVDDEESITKLWDIGLRRMGYTVEAKTNPVEALALFRSQPHRFDLVITDLSMPRMTGDKLIKEILDVRPDIPIIISTGYNERIDAEKAKEIGAADYLQKPFDRLGLAISIRKALDKTK